MRKPLFLFGSRSQAGQETFAFVVSGRKKLGCFVEIGAHNGLFFSNTYVLENRFDWSGIGVELHPGLAKDYNLLRKSKCIEANATQIDYTEIFLEFKMPPKIDFLQIDIDPAHQSLNALKIIPFKLFQFGAVVFEHDGYRGEETHEVVVESRKILKENNFLLIAKDVKSEGLVFEDWWVYNDPEILERAVPFQSKEINGLELFGSPSVFLTKLWIRRLNKWQRLVASFKHHA